MNNMIARFRRNNEGIILFITILFLVILMSCNNNNSKVEPANYLALGDSYTIGESVSYDERWPVQLAARIRESGDLIDDPVIIAKTGWTTGELLQAIGESGIKDTFDLVTLLIGVNNQYRGYDTANYRSELKMLIDKSVAFAGGDNKRVIMVSIPDWGVTPFAAERNRVKISEEIDIFNSIMRSEAERRKIVFVDITPVSRMAGSKPELVAGDGLHPSGEMYSLWVDLVLPYSIAVIRN